MSAAKMRLQSILMAVGVSYESGAQYSINYGGAESALAKQQATADSLVKKAEASAKALSRQQDLMQQRSHAMLTTSASGSGQMTPDYDQTGQRFMSSKQRRQVNFVGNK